MREVFAEVVRLLTAGEPFVLATVVETSGSTPQKPGAKLLVRADGTLAGTIGGGCVEADVWDVAMNALRSGGASSLRDFVLADDLAAETGMVCGGTLTVFIEPITNEEGSARMARAIEQALAGGEPVSQAVVVSCPRRGRVGAKLLFDGGGLVGSLGEAAWDEAVLPALKALRTKGGYDLIEVGGDTHVFVEGFLAPPTVLIVGAGHIAQALSPLAKHLGFRVVVLDDRPDFASRERFPEADEVVASDIESGLGAYPVGPSTAVIVATRGHKQDDAALRVAASARGGAGYIGLVGSRRKVILIYSQLLQEGIPYERLRRIHAPIGLDLGGNTPTEIALSILAEVVMERYGRTGHSLKLDERLLPKAEAKARLTTAG